MGSDRPVGQVDPLAYVTVRKALGGELGDLELLGTQFGPGLGGSGGTYALEVKLNCVAPLMSVAVALAAVTALTGCSGDSDDATLSTSEAGYRYVALVTPVNEAAVALQRTLTAEPPRRAEIQQAASRYVDASLQFKEDAEDTQWPESVSDDIAFLVFSNGRALDGIRALARVQTTADLQTWSRERGPEVSIALADATAASGDIRKELGLPSPSSPAT